MNANKHQSVQLVSQDEIALSSIAAGVVELSQQVAEDVQIKTPYPDSLQRGMDKLAAIKLKRGEEPPIGVPDLLNWCSRPLSSWRLELPDGAIGESDCLIKDQMPTRTCEVCQVSSRRLFL